MDLLGQMRMADFLFKLYRGDMDRLAGYPFVPQKKQTIPLWDKADQMPRATPEQEGVSSSHIQSFLKDLARSKQINPHSVLILRHGKVITQAHFRPYRGDYPHMLFSLSKTFTATAVGMAVDEGVLSLNDRLVDLFPDKVTPLHNPKLNTVTLRDLLTMQAGIKFNELGSVMEKDWARGFMQSDFVHQPRTHFFYNSINSYMISSAIHKKTGMGLVEYLKPRLFVPLGIRDVFWETCPQGIEKGGWGLSLRIEDAAKLGQLYLQGGAWTVEGSPKQLLSRTWVTEATRNQLSDKQGAGDGYGYHIWIGKNGNSYHFNGMFGQYVAVFPRYDVVVALFSGSPNLMPEGGGLDLIYRYFDREEVYSGIPLPKNVHALKGLVHTIKGLTLMKKEVMPRVSHTPKGLFEWCRGRLFPDKQAAPALTRAEFCHRDCEYSLGKNHGSLLPMVIQGVHGNFSRGIDRIHLVCTPGSCSLKIWEGDQVNTVEAGTDGNPRYSEVQYKGECYMVGSMARWTMDEDDRDVLKVYCSFIETPDTRLLKFIFDDDKVYIRFEELPDVRDAIEMVGSLSGYSGGSRESARESLQRRARQMVAPKAVGKRVLKEEKEKQL